jgi:hypothetical protein
MAEKVYKCLNPVGYQDPVDLVPISKRLDKLDGKKIFLSIGAGGEQDILIPLRKQLPASYPQVDWQIKMAGAHLTIEGSKAISEEEMKVADAVIRGVVW